MLYSVGKTKRCPQGWYEWVQTASVYLSCERFTYPDSLAHLHVSLACLEPRTSALCLIVKVQHAFSKPPSSSCTESPQWTKRACRDSTFRGASDSSRWLYFEGLGDWAGMANMTVLSPWPGVEVMSLSEMNHSTSPQGPPGLFLKSYIIVLLRGGPAVNIVMIPFL